MKVQHTLILLLGALVAGCAATDYAQLHSIPHATKPAIPKTKQGCESVGGHWSQQGLGGGPLVCDVQARDALKICTDDTQCEGECLVEKSIPDGQTAIGSCAPFLVTYGCHKFIQKGLVRSTCTD